MPSKKFSCAPRSAFKFEWCSLLSATAEQTNRGTIVNTSLCVCCVFCAEDGCELNQKRSIKSCGVYSWPPLLNVCSTPNQSAQRETSCSRPKANTTKRVNVVSSFVVCDSVGKRNELNLVLCTPLFRAIIIRVLLTATAADLHLYCFQVVLRPVVVVDDESSGALKLARQSNRVECVCGDPALSFAVGRTGKKTHSSSSFVHIHHIGNFVIRVCTLWIHIHTYAPYSTQILSRRCRRRLHYHR